MACFTREDEEFGDLAIAQEGCCMQRSALLCILMEEQWCVMRQVTLPHMSTCHTVTVLIVFWQFSLCDGFCYLLVWLCGCLIESLWLLSWGGCPFVVVSVSLCGSYMCLYVSLGVFFVYVWLFFTSLQLFCISRRQSQSAQQHLERFVEFSCKHKSLCLHLPNIQHTINRWIW